MPDTKKNEARYPIRVVSKRTGLSAHVIRVWERRYQVVEPVRTDTNRRLYSEVDIERFRLLHRATAAGHAISSVAQYSKEDLEELLQTTESSLIASPLRRLNPDVDGNGRGHLLQCQEAARALDLRLLEAALLESQRHLSTEQLLSEVVAPLLEWAGDEWSLGNLGIAQEHAISSVLRQFLANTRSSLAIPKGGPVILMTTPSGQSHELGALMASVVAASEGWQEIYLGPNLPAAEIARAATMKEATAVGLSIVHPPDDPHLRSELRLIRQLLPEHMVLLVGGQSAGAYADVLSAIGAWHIETFQALRVQLRTLREMGAQAGRNA